MSTIYIKGERYYIKENIEPNSYQSFTKQIELPGYNIISIIFITAGTWHNIINIGDEPLKVYTIYAPPHHP